jgi:FAD/FMN-containing dehydrogenase
MRLTNFGGNVSFVPRHYYTPRDEREVLAVLDRHAGGHVRAIGSLHSWSDIAATDDAIVDLHHFTAVTTADRDGELWATIGGGCRLGPLLRAIHNATDATLPTLGAITRQTISGAISTGTHGSGRHSLSHYIVAVRAAAYDPDTGRARIFEWTQGQDLQGARCALGCMGLILSVTIRCVPQYLVEETVRRFETLDAVLAGEEAYPLQQFVLVPHLWSFFAFQRRVVSEREGTRSSASAVLYRLYNRVGIDGAFHLLVKALASPMVGAATVRAFYRRVLTFVVLRGVTVVQPSHRTLTMRHDLFQHLEMEAFIPARHIRSAAALVRHIVAAFAGEPAVLPDDVAVALRELGMVEPLDRLRGTYAHHYPIFFRRVLPDDTLLSETAGATEPYYTVSFFTYHAQARRAPFFVMANYLAQVLSRRYDARLHWGKYFPLGHDDVQRLYPTLADFHRTCKRTDPRGVFRNAYTARVLGL